MNHATLQAARYLTGAQDYLSHCQLYPCPEHGWVGRWPVALALASRTGLVVQGVCGLGPKGKKSIQRDVFHSEQLDGHSIYSLIHTHAVRKTSADARQSRRGWLHNLGRQHDFALVTCIAAHVYQLQRPYTIVMCTLSAMCEVRGAI